MMSDVADAVYTHCGPHTKKGTYKSKATLAIHQPTKVVLQRNLWCRGVKQWVHQVDGRFLRLELFMSVEKTVSHGLSFGLH